MPEQTRSTYNGTSLPAARPSNEGTGPTTSRRRNGFESVQDEVDRATRRRRRTWRQGAQAQPVGVGPDAAGHRRHHRHGHLRAHRNRRGQPGRAGDHDVVPGRGPGLRVCGAVLRRVRVDDPDRRQRLHLRLRHARRAGGVDDRLGLDPRIRRRLDDRRDRLERLHAAPAGGLRHHAAGRASPPRRRSASSTCRP